MEEYSSTNIHSDWLRNISNQLMKIQDMERLAREGCVGLIDYLQLPMNLRQIIIPEARYKNYCFILMEIDILVDNLSVPLKDKYEFYKRHINFLLKDSNKRNLFLREKRVHNQVYAIEVLPLFELALNSLLDIKSKLIKDIGHLLYLPEDKEKKW